MAFIYTRTALKGRINAGIKNKIGILIDENETVNQAVREVIRDIDLRSTKRRSALSPALFNDIDEYAAPTDLKDQKVVDIAYQVNRSKLDEFYLVPTSEFSRRRDNRAIAVDDRDAIRKLLIHAEVDDTTILSTSLDSLTSGGGTWTLFGDAINVAVDSDNYVKGSASLKFDISAAGGTTAGIFNSGLTAFDITPFLNHSVFVYVYIQSTVGLTNFIIQIGNDASNYYGKTVTVSNDNNAFVVGLNLLRFDLGSSTQTGSVTETSCSFIRLFMTKTAGKISETNYRFDQIVFKKGVIANLYYYSNYGWQTSAGAYLLDSTSDLDVLVADSSEYELFIEKGIELAAREVDEEELRIAAKVEYISQKNEYLMNNPSEALLMTTTYYDF